jgi:hypothetical protein
VRHLVAGFIEFIPGGGQQMHSWRWFFRIVAIMIILLAVVSFLLCRTHPGAESGTPTDAEDPDPMPRWRRLDLVGALTMLSAIVLLTLGLTLGRATGGRRPASWPLPPLVPLFVAFFFWEARLEPAHALIPTSTWRIPNFAIFLAMALPIYAWWAVNFLALIETYVHVYHERPIIGAVRMLPQAVVAFASRQSSRASPASFRPWLTVLIGQVLCVVGYILFSRTSTFAGRTTGASSLPVASSALGGTWPS